MNEVKRSSENGATSKETLILSYAGKRGCKMVRSLEEQLKRSLPSNVKFSLVQNFHLTLM